MTPEEVVEAMDGQLRAMAGKLAVGRPHQFDDLLQEGRLAAWRAAQRWDGTGSVTGWCARRANGAMIDWIRSIDWSRHYQRRKHDAVSLDAPTAEGLTLAETIVDLRDGPEGTVLAGDLDDRIAAALDELPEAIREAVLADNTAALAEISGLTESRISQLRHDGLRLLRARLWEEIAA